MKQQVENQLVLSRLLFYEGQSLKRSTYPRAALSLLMFQDAIEAFLHGAQLSSPSAISRREPNFHHLLDFVRDDMNNRLGHSMVEYNDVLKMNRMRVHFKHEGNWPRNEDIGWIAATADRFVSENCRLFFGRDFASVSIASMVADPTIRAHIEQAERALDAENWLECLEQSALTFYLVTRQPDDRRLRNSFIHSGRLMMDLQSPRNDSVDRQLGRFGAELINSLSALENAIWLIGLGADFRRVAEFNHVTPYVWSDHTGETKLEWQRSTESLGGDDARFAFEFALATALTVTPIVSDK